jgi:transposase InsO family protein
MLNEFYRIAFRKKLYASIGELQDDLDEWIKSYNEERPHQGRPFLDAIPIAREKTIAA